MTIYDNLTNIDEIGDAVYLDALTEELGKMNPNIPKSQLNKLATSATVARNKVIQKNPQLVAKQERRMLNATMSVEDKFLLSKWDQLDVDTQRAIREGSIRRVKFVAYKRIAIPDNSSGTIEIWNAQNQQIYGISNIDKNFLPNAYNFVLSKIKVSYAVILRNTPTIANNGLEPNLGRGMYTNVQAVAPFVPPNTSLIPSELLNSHFVFKVNNEPILELPLSEMFVVSPQANYNYVQGYSDYNDLAGSLYLLKQQNPIIAEIKIPDGVTLPNPVQNQWTPIPGPNQFLTHALEIKLAGSTTQPGKNS